MTTWRTAAAAAAAAAVVVTLLAHDTSNHVALQCTAIDTPLEHVV